MPPRPRPTASCGDLGVAARDARRAATSRAASDPRTSRRSPRAGRRCSGRPRRRPRRRARAGARRRAAPSARRPQVALGRLVVDGVREGEAEALAHAHGRERGVLLVGRAEQLERGRALPDLRGRAVAAERAPASSCTAGDRRGRPALSRGKWRTLTSCGALCVGPVSVVLLERDGALGEAPVVGGERAAERRARLQPRLCAVLEPEAGASSRPSRASSESPGTSRA